MSKASVIIAIINIVIAIGAYTVFQNQLQEKISKESWDSLARQALFYLILWSMIIATACLAILAIFEIFIVATIGPLKVKVKDKVRLKDSVDFTINIKTRWHQKISNGFIEMVLVDPLGQSTLTRYYYAPSIYSPVVGFLKIEKERELTLNWIVPEYAPNGKYTVIITIYDRKLRNPFVRKYVRLDKKL